MVNGQKMMSTLLRAARRPKLLFVVHGVTHTQFYVRRIPTAYVAALAFADQKRRWGNAWSLE